MDSTYRSMTVALNESSDWGSQEGAKRPSTRLHQRPSDLSTTPPSPPPVVASTALHGSATIGDSYDDSALICRYPGCKSAGRVFKRSYELKRHTLIHFPDKKLRCPVYGCRKTTKTKTKTTWARLDKFREHVQSHGQAALLYCPINGCNLQPLTKPDLYLHIVRQHALVDRLQISSFLEALRIGNWRGGLICPLPCSENSTGRILVLDHHFQTHDLKERIKFIDSIKNIPELSLGWGVASCPICSFQTSEWDPISKLCAHVETHHTDERVAYGLELAHLLCHFTSSKHSVSREYQQLFTLIRRFTPNTTQLVNSATSKSAFTPSTGDASPQTFAGYLPVSTPLSVIGNYASIDADAVVFTNNDHSDFFSGIDPQRPPLVTTTLGRYPITPSEPTNTHQNWLTYQVLQDSPSVHLPLDYLDSDQWLQKLRGEPIWGESLSYPRGNIEQPIQDSMSAGIPEFLLPNQYASPVGKTQADSFYTCGTSSSDGNSIGLDSQSQFQARSSTMMPGYQIAQLAEYSSTAEPYQGAPSWEQTRQGWQNEFDCFAVSSDLQEQLFNDNTIPVGCQTFPASSMSDLGSMEPLLEDYIGFQQ